MILAEPASAQTENTAESFDFEGIGSSFQDSFIIFFLSLMLLYCIFFHHLLYHQIINRYGPIENLAAIFAEIQTWFG